MIDTSENLIIIKGQIRTPEIESCQNYDSSYKIVFQNVPSAYTYKKISLQASVFKNKYVSLSFEAQEEEIIK